MSWSNIVKFDTDKMNLFWLSKLECVPKQVEKKFSLGKFKIWIFYLELLAVNFRKRMRLVGIRTSPIQLFVPLKYLMVRRGALWYHLASLLLID